MERAGPSVTGHRLVLTLKRYLPRQLEEPGLVRTGRRTEVPIGNVGIDVCIVCPVEDVEEFEPELEAYALRDWSIFEEICICFKEVWPTELHRIFVAFLPKSWGCEIRFRDSPL